MGASTIVEDTSTIPSGGRCGRTSDVGDRWQKNTEGWRMQGIWKRLNHTGTMKNPYPPEEDHIFSPPKPLVVEGNGRNHHHGFFLAPVPSLKASRPSHVVDDVCFMRLFRCPNLEKVILSPSWTSRSGRMDRWHRHVCDYSGDPSPKPREHPEKHLRTDTFVDG